MDLNSRNRDILRAIVASYIELAFPVGSQTVTKNFSFGLSPATIRNIMSDLEEMGYLMQPHPSAGRVPTSKGYRLYIDEILEQDRPNPYGERFLEENYLSGKQEDFHDLLQETTRMLSLLSHYAGVVTAPNLSTERLDRLEFILLREGQVLVVQVSEGGQVHHRVFEADPDLSQKDLIKISSFLNNQFHGHTIEEIRNAILRQMGDEKALYDRLLQKALYLAQMAVSGKPEEEEIFVEGASNIIKLPDFADTEKMRELFKTFEEKASIINLLNRCIDTEGVQIFIGPELNQPGISDCSFVVSRYHGGHNSVGTLGVIGPTRMEYDRVIPLVEQTARLLGRLLDQLSARRGDASRGNRAQ
ncbi:MAG TPA: heat-inducible transcriptional repressor HrcA [Nitrospiria bacterium]|nr:heat-inducible transcriptional repressor HrcA [Nitrospiria bacterium]